MRFTVDQLNAARDAHRHRGTTGGKGNARTIGLDCHALALANVASIWAEFRSWSRNERIRPLGDYVPATDFPF